MHLQRDERILWRYDDPGIENGASDQAYRAAEGTADFKKMYFQRSRRKKAGRNIFTRTRSAGKTDGSTLDDEEVEYSLISQKLNITLTVVRALEEQGVLEIKNHKIYRNPVKEKEQKRHFITYTEEQERAIRTFENDYKKGIRKTYLLYGVTGSGKTEVYME